MKHFWLLQNPLYNVTHVREATWWRRVLLGLAGFTVLATAEAADETAARDLFLQRGCSVREFN